MRSIFSKFPNRHDWWSFWGNGIRVAITPFFYMAGTLLLINFLYDKSENASLMSLIPEALFWAFIFYVPISILMLLTRDPIVDSADPIWRLLSKHKDYAARYLLYSGFIVMSGLMLVLFASFIASFLFYSDWAVVVTAMYSFLIWPIIAISLAVWHFQLLSFIDIFETPYTY